MRFQVLTLFPDAFRALAGYSILGRAVQSGLLSITATDIRAFTADRHGTADDYQFGGGPGMALKPEPVFAAVDDALAAVPESEGELTPVVQTSRQRDRCGKKRRPPGSIRRSISPTTSIRACR